MALVHPFNVNDVDYAAAYSRIVVVRADKADAYVFVNTYADEASRQREDAPIHQQEYITSLAALSGDLFVKAYEFLKTCPGFEAAVDHPSVDAG